MNAVQHRHTIVLGLSPYFRITIHQIHVRTLIRPFLIIGIGFLGWLFFFGNVESETTGEVRPTPWT